MDNDTRTQETLEIVSGLIREIVGDELAFDGPIDFDTKFSDDLELESIEFVALAEQLQQRFGSEVDFVKWISSKQLDEIIGLTVGECVEFIVSCRS